MHRRGGRASRLAAMVVAALTVGAGAAYNPAAAGAASVRTEPVHAASTAHVGWNGYAVLAHATFSGVSCPSVSTCYAAGGFSNNDSLVAKTTNGGVSWSTLTFTSTASIGTLDDIACPDTTHCLATGGGTVGTAFHTTDGVHWTQLTLPAHTTEQSRISCISDTTCFSVSLDGTGLHTTNFGTSWTPLAYHTTSGATAISNTAIYFQSALVGWVTGGDSTSCSNSQCDGHIQETVNGGSTWSFVATPAGMPFINGIACKSASDCVAAGNTFTRAVSYQTINGGTSWSATTFPAGMELVNGMTCVNTSVCFAVGDEHLLFSNTGTYASSTAVAARTTNGGASWSLQQISGGLSVASGVSCASTSACVIAGWTHTTAGLALTTDGGVPPPPGYYLVASDGGIFTFGSAVFHGSTGNVALAKPVVGMAVDATSNGYWMVASDGGIFTFGDARFHGSTGNVRLAKPIVGMATDPVTGGYWMVASDGGIFSFDAPFYGSMGGKAISAPIVGITVLADGSGYYLTARDGTVYAFGAARFDTCIGKAPAGFAAIAGMGTDRVQGGYWLSDVAGDVAFCRGAPFHGQVQVKLAKPVVGMAATPDAGGYWLVATDGGIFSFGDAKFLGSTGAVKLTKPIVGMAATPSA